MLLCRLCFEMLGLYRICDANLHRLLIVFTKQLGQDRQDI